MFYRAKFAHLLCGTRVAASCLLAETILRSSRGLDFTSASLLEPWPLLLLAQNALDTPSQHVPSRCVHAPCVPPSVLLLCMLQRCKYWPTHSWQPGSEHQKQQHPTQQTLSAQQACADHGGVHHSIPDCWPLWPRTHGQQGHHRRPKTCGQRWWCQVWRRRWYVPQPSRLLYSCVN